MYPITAALSESGERIMLGEMVAQPPAGVVGQQQQQQQRLAVTNQSGKRDSRQTGIQAQRIEVKRDFQVSVEETAEGYAYRADQTSREAYMQPSTTAGVSVARKT